VQVGDMVRMPDLWGKADIGIVLSIREMSVFVYWFNYGEKTWEPKRWLKVVGAQVIDPRSPESASDGSQAAQQGESLGEGSGSAPDGSEGL